MNVQNEKYERQMKKGVLDMLVLKLLESDEKYGYQLISELNEKSDGVFILKEGTLYPILYRLEDEAFIESNWSLPEGIQVSRKNYSITAKGKAALEQIATTWNSIQSGIDKIMETPVTK